MSTYNKIKAAADRIARGLAAIFVAHEASTAFPRPNRGALDFPLPEGLDLKSSKGSASVGCGERELEELTVPGLRNSGNNCFLNSVLQALASSPVLVASVAACAEGPVSTQDARSAGAGFSFMHEGDSSSQKADMPLANALAALLQELSRPCGKSQVASPRRVMSALALYADKFDMALQQDAAEALDHLAAALEQECMERFRLHRRALLSWRYASRDWDWDLVDHHLEARATAVPRLIPSGGDHTPPGIAAARRLSEPAALKKGGDGALGNKGGGREVFQAWQDALRWPLEGTVGSLLECLTCGHQFTLQLQPFNELQLSPPQSSPGHYVLPRGCTLDNLLKLFTSSETMSSVACVRCSHVATARHARRDGLLQGEHAESTPSSANGDPPIVVPEPRKKRLETAMKVVASCICSNECACEALVQSAGGDWVKRSSPAVKRLLVGRAPELLCLQIQRVNMSISTGQPHKVSGLVTFPLVLDLRPYTLASALSDPVPDEEDASVSSAARLGDSPEPLPNLVPASASPPSPRGTKRRKGRGEPEGEEDGEEGPVIDGAIVHDARDARAGPAEALRAEPGASGGALVTPAVGEDEPMGHGQRDGRVCGEGSSGHDPVDDAVDIPEVVVARERNGDHKCKASAREGSAPPSEEVSEDLGGSAVSRLEQMLPSINGVNGVHKERPNCHGSPKQETKKNNKKELHKNGCIQIHSGKPEGVEDVHGRCEAGRFVAIPADLDSPESRSNASAVSTMPELSPAQRSKLERRRRKKARKRTSSSDQANGNEQHSPSGSATHPSHYYPDSLPTTPDAHSITATGKEGERERDDRGAATEREITTEEAQQLVEETLRSPSADQISEKGPYKSMNGPVAAPSGGPQMECSSGDGNHTRLQPINGRHVSESGDAPRGETAARSTPASLDTSEACASPLPSSLPSGGVGLASVLLESLRTCDEDLDLELKDLEGRSGRGDRGDLALSWGSDSPYLAFGSPGGGGVGASGSLYCMYKPRVLPYFVTPISEGAAARFGTEGGMSPLPSSRLGALASSKSDAGQRGEVGGRQHQQQQKLPYGLVSVVVHHGSAFGGHYTVYRKMAVARKQPQQRVVGNGVGQNEGAESDMRGEMAGVNGSPATRGLSQIFSDGEADGRMHVRADGGVNGERECGEEGCVSGASGLSFPSCGDANGLFSSFEDGLGDNDKDQKEEGSEEKNRQERYEAAMIAEGCRDESSSLRRENFEGGECSERGGEPNRRLEAREGPAGRGGDWEEVAGCTSLGREAEEDVCWFSVSDTHVRRVPEREVLSVEASLLFYERLHSSPEVSATQPVRRSCHF